MASKSPSRSHGEGSIYRSDYTRPGSGVTVERWIASVNLGTGPNGKRLRKRITGPTRKAVADKLRELQQPLPEPGPNDVLIRILKTGSRSPYCIGN